MQLINRLKVLLTAIAFLFLSMLTPLQAGAATVNPSPSAKISFTFDEGYNSALTQAAPVMAKYGVPGTVYITTNCMGMTASPNGCRADTNKSYLTWDQVAQLRNAYGWEIGSHTVNHYCLASTGDGSDCQTNQLSPSEVEYELAQSKADLAAHGYNALSYASPYGDYNAATIAKIAKYYTSQRGFADVGYNSWPNSDYFLKVQPVQGNIRVNTVKGYIDSAIANNQWLVLVFHDIKTRASNRNSDYEYSTSDLEQIAAYVKSKNLPAVNISSGLVTSDVNLLVNSSFNNGIADGWTSDAPTNIIKDTGQNGSFPDPANSVKFVSSNQNIHLFSPKVSVDPNAIYMLKNFLNVQNLSNGQVGFYIDEYNSLGNWVSSQSKAAENSVFAEELNFTYKPSSSAVRSASLQIYVTANSGITAYLDNVQWFPLTAVSPPAAQTNLMINGTFDNGIADGWRTDSSTTMVKDTANNGSPANPVNSIKITSTNRNTHLFSPILSVDSTKTYSLISYLDFKQRTSGEVGFYIDEYDANGNWISGQWKTAVTALGPRDVGFNYTPSSANVKKASLQIYVTANSGILAYYDNVRWYLN